MPACVTPARIEARNRALLHVNYDRKYLGAALQQAFTENA